MNKNSKIIIGVVLLIGLVIAAIIVFKKSSSESVTTSSTNTQVSNSGLSSLLGSLNLSGLSFSLI